MAERHPPEWVSSRSRARWSAGSDAVEQGFVDNLRRLEFTATGDQDDHLSITIGLWSGLEGRRHDEVFLLRRST